MKELSACPKCGFTNSLEIAESHDPITFELNVDLEQAYFECWNCHRVFLLERRKSFSNQINKFRIVGYSDPN